MINKGAQNFSKILKSPDVTLKLGPGYHQNSNLASHLNQRNFLILPSQEIIKV
jgi:hypothetical protein